MDTLSLNLSRLARQASDALHTQAIPGGLLLTLTMEGAPGFLERFDLFTLGEDRFTLRRVWWDSQHDLESMEDYYSTLEGLEKLREKHRPRKWDPTLQETQVEVTSANAVPLLDVLSSLSGGVCHEVEEKGIRMTLTRGTTEKLCWQQGDHPPLDGLAAELQGLVWGDPAETSEQGVRVKVDEVVPGTVFIEHHPLHRHLERQVKSELKCSSFDRGQQTLPTRGNHALIEAVHQAFSQHHPLTLSPDILWLTLSQGAALHIQNHAEELRHLFVAHQEKEKLTVSVLQLSTPEDWKQVVEGWTALIREHVGDTTAGVFECDFSTTTDVSLTASRIVMMDGFREYFDYEVVTVCGIPEIKLTGTVEDWLKLRQKVLHLERWGLSWWTRHLLPLCDQWIQTARGRPSRSFWQSIYKPERFYGPDTITGWLKLLFPYLSESAGGEEKYTRKNPCLEGPFQGFVTGSSLSPSQAPDGISRVLFNVREGDQQEQMQLLAGCVGLTQHRETLHIEPLIGWAVASLSVLARGNSTTGHIRNMDMAALQNLGIAPEVLESLGWLEGVTLIGNHPDWSFLLGDLQDHGEWVELGQGKQGLLLVHKGTGEIGISTPAGKRLHANQSLMQFERCVEVLQDEHLAFQRPDETGGNWEAHARRIERYLKEVDPTLFVHPETFWGQVLQGVERGNV